MSNIVDRLVFGNKQIEDICFGNQILKSVYYGDNLIWQKGDSPEPPSIELYMSPSKIAHWVKYTPTSDIKFDTFDMYFASNIQNGTGFAIYDLENDVLLYSETVDNQNVGNFEKGIQTEKYGITCYRTSINITHLNVNLLANKTYYISIRSDFWNNGSSPYLISGITDLLHRRTDSTWQWSQPEDQLLPQIRNATDIVGKPYCTLNGVELL